MLSLGRKQVSADCSSESGLSFSPCFLRSHLVQFCFSLDFSPTFLACIHYLLTFPANSGFAPQSLFPLLNLNHFRLVLALKYVSFFFNACCIGLLHIHACTLPCLLLIRVICELGMHCPSVYEPAETWSLDVVPCTKYVLQGELR